MSDDLILADEPALVKASSNLDASDPFGGTPKNWTPAGSTNAEARRLLAIGLGPTPLDDLDRALGLRDGDLDLDPPEDDVLFPPERPVRSAFVLTVLRPAAALKDPRFAELAKVLGPDEIVYAPATGKAVARG